MDLDDIAKENERLNAKNETYARQIDGLRTERDALKAELVDVRTKIDADVSSLAKDIASLGRERDSLHGRVEELTRERDELKANASRVCGQLRSACDVKDDKIRDIEEKYQNKVRQQKTENERLKAKVSELDRDVSVELFESDDNIREQRRFAAALALAPAIYLKQDDDNFGTFESVDAFMKAVAEHADALMAALYPETPAEPAVDSISPGRHLAREGETEFAVIIRNRSGQDSGELDFILDAGRVWNMPNDDRKRLAEVAAMLLESIQNKIDKGPDSFSQPSPEPPKDPEAPADPVVAHPGDLDASAADRLAKRLSRAGIKSIHGVHVELKDNGDIHISPMPQEYQTLADIVNPPEPPKEEWRFIGEKFRAHIRDNVYSKTSFRKVEGPNGCIWIAGASDETADLIVSLLNHHTEPKAEVVWWIHFEASTADGFLLVNSRGESARFNVNLEVARSIVRLLNANREEG